VYQSGGNCELTETVKELSPTVVDKYYTLRGKQPRSIDKVSNFLLSAKGSEIPKTTWRWAWKQPSVKKRVTTYKMRSIAPKIHETKVWNRSGDLHWKKKRRKLEKVEKRKGKCKGSRTFCRAKKGSR